MSTDEKYNGWTNRETWAVALHINNDQGWQESVHEALKSGVGDWNEDLSWSPGITEPSLTRNRARQAGEIIRSEVEDVFDVETYGTVDSAEDCQNFVRRLMPIMSDIGSLWRVNWTELGSSFLTDLEGVDSDS